MQVNENSQSLSKHTFGYPDWESLPSALGKSEVKDGQGFTPPRSPKRIRDVASSKIGEDVAARRSSSKKLTKVTDLSLDPASQMKKSAEKIGFLKQAFTQIGDFFTRFRNAIKSLFSKKETEPTLEQKFQKHVAELAAHLAVVKESNMSKMSLFTQNHLIKPFLNRLVLDPSVLPHVFDKTRELLNKKLVGERAKHVINELENRTLKKLADDLALISDNYPSAANDMSKAQREEAIIKSLYLTDEEKDVLSKRDSIVEKYFPKTTDSTSRVLERLEQENRKLPQEIEDMRLLNRIVAAEEKRAKLEAKGHLHKAVAPLTEKELALVDERYDIIRRHYPKVEKFERIEALWIEMKSNEEKSNRIKQIEQAYIHMKTKVNKINYGVSAVIEDLKKRLADPKTPIDQVGFLEEDIKKLEAIKDIDEKVFKYEQAYIRKLSKKIFDFIYPNGVPSKFSIPLRVINFMGRTSIDPEEILLALLDNMLINAVDTLSHPSMIYSLLNNAFKELNGFSIEKKEGEDVEVNAPPSASNEEVLVNPALSKLLFEVFRIAVPHQVKNVAAKAQSIANNRVGSMMTTVAGYAYQGLATTVSWIADQSVKLNPVRKVASKIQHAKERAINFLPEQVQGKLIDPSKKALIRQLEVSVDPLIEFGLEQSDALMFPSGLRAFRPGISQGQVENLRNELHKNIGSFIKSQTYGLDSGVGLSFVGANLDRFNMQVLNKHLIYGLIDEMLATLKV